MTKNSKDREPYFYPDYIVEAFCRIGQASCSKGYPLLNRRIDVIHVLFNQFKEYPLTEQVYSYVWLMVNSMTSNGYYEWVKEYWNYVCEYYLFTKQYAEGALDEQKRRFQEFHLMIGVQMVYYKRYDLLHHFFTFTSSLPAKYPLVPSSFREIMMWYKQLSRENEQRLYLLKYSMLGMNNGAIQERKIESLLLDYVALLMIRLYSVNDYNITYSKPLELPDVGNTIEDADRNIMIADVLKKRISKWVETNNSLKEMGFNNYNIHLAKTLLEQYQNACRQFQKHAEDNVEISERKREELKTDMMKALLITHNRLPVFMGVDDDRTVVTKLVAKQSVELDARMILAGREIISNNLGEALVNALYTEIRMNYCYQYLLHGSPASFAIPYRDIGKALDRLELNNNYTILAMGVSSYIFDEIEGFTRDDDMKVSYKGIDVKEIASNENSFIIMKNGEIPYISLRNLDIAENKERLKEIDSNYHLYSNIDDIDTNNMILRAQMGYQLHIVEPMRYVRLRIAYQLESDKVVLNRVLPIKNYIV